MPGTEGGLAPVAAPITAPTTTTVVTATTTTTVAAGGTELDRAAIDAIIAGTDLQPSVSASSATRDAV